MEIERTSYIDFVEKDKVRPTHKGEWGGGGVCPGIAGIGDKRVALTLGPVFVGRHSFCFVQCYSAVTL